MLAPGTWPLALQIALSLAIVVPLGPMVYRLAYQPLASASVLVLLIVSVAVHMTLVGLGLLFFGAEGSRTPSFSEGSLELGDAQSLRPDVVGGRLLCPADRGPLSVLRAQPLRQGFARHGHQPHRRAPDGDFSTVMAGKLSFLLAALIGAFSGILIAPITTIYYDTGFLVGLKGFVGAIIGGLASYPVAAAGAVLVGLLESFSSFWASAFKEVIVFTLIIPVLVWRSLTTHHVEEE